MRRLGFPTRMSPKTRGNTFRPCTPKRTNLVECSGSNCFPRRVSPLQSKSHTAIDRYALHPESHMTEASEKCSGVNAATLYSSWAEYWNLSKPVLVEKTPNHMVMTRFLQCLFSPQRAKFVITIRHPFGATHFKWKLPKQIDNVKRHCGRPWIKNWLRQMTVLKEDLPYLAHARIVIFENFTTGDVQQNYEDMMGSIDIKPTMKITVQKRPPRVSFDHMKKHHESRTQLGSKQQIDEGDVPRKTRLGRKLLGFVGDPSNLVLYTEKWFAWVDAWKERYGDLFESRVCQAVFDDFEDKVAEFGYSLRNPERVTQPRAFSPSMVLPRS
eukprot:m.180380 g.180380  ORF g.180380 m.180380 type:complete len:326 (-) comp14946_c0_seq13:1287-2264(-)